MKKIVLFFTPILYFFLINAGISQTCLGVEIKKGGGYETASYNAKNKPQGKTIFKFKEARQEDNLTVVDIEMETLSAKGKSDGKNTYSVRCDGNKMIVDAASLISSEQLKMVEEYQMSFTGKGIERPASLKVGDILPDASITGKGRASSLDVTMDLTITNRKVESKEQVTVPYGTFEAYKITSTVHMRMVTVIPISFEYQVHSYVIPDELWELKSETYRNGKLTGHTELVRVF